MWKIRRLAREDVPNVPDEIFKSYIEMVNSWEADPFDSWPGGRWFYRLGHISVEAFNNLHWSLGTISLRNTSFHETSDKDIGLILEFCTSRDEAKKRALAEWCPINSMERVCSIAEYIHSTGRLPAPIIGVRTSEGLFILDGNHRISAAVLVNKDIPIDAWVGSNA